MQKKKKNLDTAHIPFTKIKMDHRPKRKLQNYKAPRW